MGLNLSSALRSCVILGKLPNLSEPCFLIWKTWIIIVPISQGLLEDSSLQDLDMHSENARSVLATFSLDSLGLKLRNPLLLWGGLSKVRNTRPVSEPS